MIIRSKSSFPGVTVGLDPDAVTLIAAMTTTPDAARQQLISDHIVALKADGVWSQLDIYYILAAHDTQASRLNWKSPGDFTLTANGTITFTVDRGWQGDGSTGYLNTGWIPATHGVNYALDDASFGVYSRTDTDQSSEDGGCRDAANTNVLAVATKAANQAFARINQDGAAISGASVSSAGLFAVRRASTAVTLLRNGGGLLSGTVVSTSRPNYSVFIGARNTAGVASLRTTRQYASAFTGAAMSEAQQLALYDALQNGILAAVGAAV
jgi:hypothetical protein